MARLTRAKDKYPCRIKTCRAESWMEDYYNDYPKESPCQGCPFEEIINKLAEYEDLEEKGKVNRA